MGLLKVIDNYEIKQLKIDNEIIANTPKHSITQEIFTDYLLNCKKLKKKSQLKI